MRNLFLLFFAAALCPGSISAQTNYAQFVNPFIGTGGHGHIFPGATAPHGMVQLSPDTRLDGWDGCGGYHYSDSFIYGFSHTHLSGTGVSDYGDILVMPMNGEPSPNNKVYGSAFSHAREQASAGFYKVHLDDDDIDVSLTATTRGGFHSYTFNRAGRHSVILDLVHRDEVLRSDLHVRDASTITGLRQSKGWANNQQVYFAIRFSSPIARSGIWLHDSIAADMGKNMENQKNLKAWFSFDLPASRKLFVKVGISSVSEMGALANLDREIPLWDFDATRRSVENDWNKELGKIEVTTANKDLKTIFYTALYHTAIVPNVYMDIDGKYRGRDGQVHTAEGFTNYSVFSLWDTYRGAHPLYTLIDKQRTTDYINTFLHQYQQGGYLPVWELSGCETGCMIGYHSVPVIWDAYQKGIRGFDASLALRAMQASATQHVLGLPAVMSKGLVNTEDDHESVSKTLEYAYDDWCIAQLAKATGNDAVYTTYIQRAQLYQNVLDRKTTFMRPRKNGDWLAPFDPREVNNHFTEANSWQYSFYMPQDIGGYLAITGGPKAFEQKLDKLFTAPQATTGRDQSDITGLIGQYAHGNEPSHHIAYLYDYTDHPAKTQEMISRILHTMYSNSPDGLIGNEDCGQMSAWFVLSSMGFYPVTPGSGNYDIGSPIFDEVKIHLENGKTTTIKARNAGRTNPYIGSLLVNGAAQHLPYFTHQQLESGSTIRFDMQSSPSKFFQRHVVETLPATELLVANPVIEGGETPFLQTRKVDMYAPTTGSVIYYTVDGTMPDKSSERFTKPLIIDRSLTLQAIAIMPSGKSSYVTTATYRKRENNWKVISLAAYEQAYAGGGKEGLIDGITGTTDWRKGNWQGFQGKDLDIVIDLGKMQSIHSVSLGLLQDAGAWIVFPPSATISFSADGKRFRDEATWTTKVAITDATPQRQYALWNLEGIQARYIKILARQYGSLPAWHLGAGGQSHIFADEIMIK